MIKILIKKNGEITNSGKFDNQIIADTWLAKEKANNSFGKNERWVREEQEDISTAIDTREININEEVVIEYKMLADYIVEQSDITDEVEQQIRAQTLKALGKAARLACEEAYDLISGHNLDNELTAEQITQMTITFAPIIQALQLKRPTVAKTLIQAIEVDGVILTEQLKLDVLNELKDF